MASKGAAPGAGWRDFVRTVGSEGFLRGFTSDAVLEASVLDRPSIGGNAIAAFFAATTSGMYDDLQFTKEVTGGETTYFEWEGHAFGDPVGGTTIVTRDSAGLIQLVRIYHRPLSMVLRFSAELAKRIGVES
jgi:hypothetical protein